MELTRNDNLGFFAGFGSATPLPAVLLLPVLLFIVVGFAGWFATTGFLGLLIIRTPTKRSGVVDVEGRKERRKKEKQVCEVWGLNIVGRRNPKIQ